MKKTIIIFLLLLLLINQSQLGQAADVYSEQSWIAAYYLEELNSHDRFIPFLDIRKSTKLQYSPGSFIRNILADYIMIQEFKLTNKIGNFKEVENKDEVLKRIKSIDFKDQKELQEAILNMDAILRLIDEIKRVKGNAKTILGQKYDSFQYRFYQFKATRFETPRIIEPPKFEYDSKEEKKIVEKFYRKWRGDYTQELKVRDTELRESMIITEKINSMIPISFNEIFQYRNSPLVAYKTVTLNSEQRQRTRYEFSKRGFEPKFIWRSKVGLAEIDVDKKYIEDMLGYLSIFDKEHLDYLQNKYVDQYGTEFTYKLNLTQLLNEIKERRD